MEFTIKCPDCGKDLKITVAEAEQTASKVLVRHLQESEGTWGDIAELIHANAELYYKVGDEFACTLKDGTEVVFVAAAINPYNNNEIAFVLKDCLPDKHSMNEGHTNEGGWADSDMRKYLNENIYELLPDDLRTAIKSREITQRLDGEDSISVDKIWLLSETEVFGRDSSVDVNDVHFALFKDERSRVKQIGDETWWYWLRSPLSSGDSYFVFVNTGGGYYGYGAGSAFGVSFGFLI